MEQLPWQVMTSSAHVAHIATTSDLEDIFAHGSGWLCGDCPVRHAFRAPEGWVSCSLSMDRLVALKNQRVPVAENVDTHVRDTSQEGHSSRLRSLLVQILREVVEVPRSAFLPVFCHSLRSLTAADTFPDYCETPAPSTRPQACR